MTTSQVSIWCKCPEICMISNSHLCMSMQSSTVPGFPSVPSVPSVPTFPSVPTVPSVHIVPKRS